MAIATAAGRFGIGIRTCDKSQDKLIPADGLSLSEIADLQPRANQAPTRIYAGRTRYSHTHTMAKLDWTVYKVDCLGRPAFLPLFCKTFILDRTPIAVFSVYS